MADPECLQLVRQQAAREGQLGEGSDKVAAVLVIVWQKRLASSAARGCRHAVDALGIPLLQMYS